VCACVCILALWPSLTFPERKQVVMSLRPNQPEVKKAKIAGRHYQHTRATHTFSLDVCFFCSPSRHNHNNNNKKTPDNKFDSRRNIQSSLDCVCVLDRIGYERSRRHNNFVVIKIIKHSRSFFIKNLRELFQS
jgi:hypothetical protein